MGSLLAQEQEGYERSIYFLSRALMDMETIYSTIEKLGLYIYFTCYKLRYYLLYYVVWVISQIDIIKYIFSRPLLRNWLGKWAIALSEFIL